MTAAPMIDQLKQEFEERFLDDLDECRALGYDPDYLLRMVHEHGALQASRRLLRDKQIPSGFTHLARLGEVRMSIEAFVHDNPKFHSRLQCCGIYAGNVAASVQEPTQDVVSSRDNTATDHHTDERKSRGLGPPNTAIRREGDRG